MTRVYVSIGSNIERESNIRSAVQSLKARFGPLVLSPVYESPPVGFEGNPFYNLVAGFDTDIAVEDLVTELHDIERAHGRTRTSERFAPRTLDLDLLLYGDLIRHDVRVDVPRREILDYAFVLKPLADIAPHQCHPEISKAFSDLEQQHIAREGEVSRAAFQIQTT